jgi:CheY-like chemotaxis protein
MDPKVFRLPQRLAGTGGNGGRNAILQNLPAGMPKKTASPRSVLIVEDNLDGVHSLVLLLREMGHNVEYAINGYSALDLARTFRPEVVLLDLNLPDLSGFEVCRRLKRQAALAHTRFIALTAFGQDSYREAAEAAGCERFFVKPIDPLVLEKLLAEQ